MSAELFAQVINMDKICPHGWCPPEKCLALAALTVAIRPEMCVEIGVWGGRSALPVALALREIGRGILWCIDPWSNAVSAEGQTGENLEWWKDPSKANHEIVYKDFLRALRETNTQNCVRIIRDRSENVVPPTKIDLLHVDGNHGETAVKDVERYAPHVRPGGFACLDDLQWEGGAVIRASAKLQAMGFSKLYNLGTGAMFQRTAQ